MKKLITLCTLLLCAVVTAWADVIGYTEAINGTKLDGRVLTGMTNVEISNPIKGSNITDYKGTSKSVIIDGTSYTNTDSWRKNVKNSYDNQNVGYQLTIAKGYMLNISHVSARIAVADDTYTWYVEILNASGTQVWTSGEKTSKKTGTSGIVDADVSGTAALQGLTGTITVNLWVKQGGTTKYFSINYLQLTATTAADSRPTYAMTTSLTPAGAGTITPEDGTEITQGEDVVFTATPKTGYKFVKWTIDGSDYTTNPYTINGVTSAHTAVATFEALPKITYAKDAEDAAVLGTLPGVDYAESGTNIKLPKAPFMTKEGYTLTGWNDGVNTYAVGSEVAITGDVTFTAVFEANAFELGTNAATITWPFATDNGAPAMKLEQNTGYYVWQATDEVNSIDVPMFIDTRKDAGISGKNGKVDIQSGRAQVNGGTVFTIPAVPGMVITVTATSTGSASVSSMTFAGDNADSYDAGVLTYTYKGSATTIDIIDQGSNLYPSSIAVSYPTASTKCPTPTITVGDFNFENNGYKVTIASGNTLWVSTDGSSYTEQTSPYVVYATATTHYYAKSTGAGLEDSDVADQEVTNTFDPAKPFIAWVYTKGYGTASYAFETDPMVTALQADYNVVEVNYGADTTPSADLNNADLIVCTEAMTGGKTMSNGMKAFAGVTPMIGLKAYNYSKGRWSWGTPANPGSTTQAFTPKSKLYKLLNGVALESDGTIKLATAESGNVIQTVEFGTTDTTAPEGNVILGTIGDNDAKAVMYTSKKYFGLGLSSDCWNTYTTNAVTIVKNAAAMLIDGEPLDAEVATVSGEITVSGFNTFSSSYPLDLNTVTNATAYVASAVEGDKVVLVKTTDKVAAGEGLFLAGTAGETFTIGVTTEAATLTADNKLVGLPAGGVVPVDKYVFAWPTADPSAASFYVVKTTPATLGAGKAYLDTAAGGGARLSLSFGEDAGEATGISEMKNVKADGAIFNLRGQRVAQPQKGLYIMNGKKTIVK